MKKVIQFLLSGLAILLTAYLLPGVHVTHYGYALLTAAVLSLANGLIRPILVVLTVPITVFTLGLFLLVINAAIIMLVDYFVPHFEVDSFLWAVGFSLILSIFNSLFSSFYE